MQFFQVLGFYSLGEKGEIRASYLSEIGSEEK